MCVFVLATTWIYSTVIGFIPLSADGAYAYLGSARLRICFIDFAATSGGSTFAALLLCAVVGPSLVAVSVCYSQIFVAARVQAQRIYDTELATANAGRRVSYLPSSTDRRHKYKYSRHTVTYNPSAIEQTEFQRN